MSAPGVRTEGIRTAMVLAAGLGTRMRPITDTLPKPLVSVAGRTLLDRALDMLVAAGVDRAVVNIHHLGPQIAVHLEGRAADLEGRAAPRIVLSDETGALLDSGGGVVKALAHLGRAPFFVLNADTFWLEAAGEAGGNLRRMADRLAQGDLDIVMLVVRPADATGHDGGGDFSLDDEGRLRRDGGAAPDPVIYAGALLVDPRIFDGAPAGPFSLNRCFDAAIAADRLRGVVLEGHWITVGTPPAIPAAEAAIATFEHREGSERRERASR